MTVLELLRLLAQDAPVDRIEEAAAKLVASDPVDGPAARALALAIRAGIDARRRREAELSALVDTARDLASRSDPGGVLDAIVRRARTLLATDVAYLTLADPERGDTYMRATAGSVSARFQTLRLPTGGRARRPRGPDPAALLDGRLPRRRALPAHHRDRRRRRRGGARRDLRHAAAGGRRSSSGCCSRPTARAARSAATRWRCSARWPRSRRCRWCRRAARRRPRPPSHALSTAHAGIAAGRHRARPVHRGRARRGRGRRHRGRARRAARLLGGRAGRRRRAPGGPRRRAGRGRRALHRPPRARRRAVVGGRHRRRPAPRHARARRARASWTRARAARSSGPRWSRRWCCCSGCAPPRPTTGCAPTCSPTSCAAPPPTARWSSADGCSACGCASRTSWSCAAASAPAGCCWPRPRRATAQALSGEHADAVVALVPGRDPSAVARARRPAKFAVTVGTAGPIVPADGARPRVRRGPHGRRHAGGAGPRGSRRRAGRPRLRRARRRRPRRRRRLPRAGARPARSTTTPPAAPTSSPPSPRTSRAARARAGPRCGCTCTPTRWRSGWTGSAVLLGADWSEPGARAGAAARPAPAPGARISDSCSSSSKASSPIQIRRPSPSSVM